MMLAYLIRKAKMWFTIAITFVVTLFVFAYFLWPKVRQNYRVSPWRYLMTTTKPSPPTATPPESPVPPKETPPDTSVPPKETPPDTCPVAPSEGNGEPEPEAETTLGGKEIVAETGGNVAEGPKDTNLTTQNDATEKSESEELKKDENGADGQILDALMPMETSSQNESEMDTGDKAKAENRTETDTNSELPQENERHNPDKAETDPETISEPAPESSGEQENSSETDPKLVSKPIAESPDLDNSPEKASEGEWKKVEAKSRKRGKVSDDESPPKGAKGSGHGLRRTKQRKRKEWAEFVSGQSNELQKMMGGYYASEDTETYLDGYPDGEDNPALNLNLEFYLNQIESQPNGDYIDDIHRDWFRDYDLLEQHHGYIQWLFPIQEQGLNNRAHPLQKHEIKELRQDKRLKDRLIRSYELMLDFFGMKLADKESGVIARSDKDQKQQYALLNSSFHNYLRITRILKCLGEFGLEKYQAPFCEFVLSEIFENNQLTNALKSCLSYWGKVIKDFDTRKSFYEIANSFVQADLAKNGGIVKRELNKFFF